MTNLLVRPVLLSLLCVMCMALYAADTDKPLSEIEKIDRLSDQPIAFRPVFSGRKFPAFDFEFKEKAAAIIPDTSFTAEYYGADFEKAATPEKSGRYGAVVSVRNVKGDVLFKKTFTLYHMPGDAKAHATEMRAVFHLQDEFGIPDSDKRMEEQSLATGNSLKSALFELFAKRPDGAVFLAGLAETPPGSKVNESPRGFAHNDQRWWSEMKQKLGEAPYRTIENTPEGYDADPAKKWPLMIFLHGSGERGENLDKVKVHGPPKVCKNIGEFPFILISPQCPNGTWWSVFEVNRLIDNAIAKYRVDTNRIYLTGLSMGGFGTWEVAAEFPNRFAAMAPLCGGGSVSFAQALKDIPCHVYHGDKDPAVPYRLSVQMVDAIKKAGGAKIDFTTYPGVGHDCWTQTYDKPEFYKWLLTNSLTDRGLNK